MNMGIQRICNLDTCECKKHSWVFHDVCAKTERELNQLLLVLNNGHYRYRLINSSTHQRWYVTTPEDAIMVMRYGCYMTDQITGEVLFMSQQTLRVCVYIND